MRINILCGKNNYAWDRTNLSDVLNHLSYAGWELEETIVIPRVPIYATRHKLHLIMKKEVANGEDPYSALSDPQRESRLYQSTDMRDNRIITYNGVEVLMIPIDDNEAILFTLERKVGTWDEGIEFCNSFGKGWRLPTLRELRKIQSKLGQARYWTIEEDGEGKAQYYNSFTRLEYFSRKSQKYYIQPITIVDIADIEYDIE